MVSMGRTEVMRGYGGVSASDRRAQRRRQLMQAGRHLWGAGGVAEVTVRGVSTEAGLVPRYFYEHFPDREALVLALTDQVHDELVSTLLTAGLGEPGGIEAKLRAALTAFLDLVGHDPEIHRVFADVMTGAGPLAERRRRAIELVTELVLEHGPGLLDFPPTRPGHPAPQRLLHRRRNRPGRRRLGPRPPRARR